MSEKNIMLTLSGLITLTGIVLIWWSLGAVPAIAIIIFKWGNNIFLQWK